MLAKLSTLTARPLPPPALWAEHVPALHCSPDTCSRMRGADRWSFRFLEDDAFEETHPLCVLEAYFPEQVCRTSCCNPDV